MAARNAVDAPDTTVNGSYPQAGREALPVSDVGRLLLHCADRPGLVAAVTTFLAQAGANIVSLDQHATKQSGGTFTQRTIFHLPGLATARDALERDFAQQVAARFNMHFGLTEAPNPNESRSWPPEPTTAYWTCCGATVAVNWICRW
jgi:formyltetrahydrofolate deformylase